MAENDVVLKLDYCKLMGYIKGIKVDFSGD